MASDEAYKADFVTLSIERLIRQRCCRPWLNLCDELYMNEAIASADIS